MLPPKPDRSPEASTGAGVWAKSSLLAWKPTASAARPAGMLNTSPEALASNTVDLALPSNTLPTKLVAFTASLIAAELGPNRFTVPERRSGSTSEYSGKPPFSCCSVVPSL